MILEMAFVVFIGLLVFGPKKTLEMSQEVGRSIAKFERATGEIQAQIEAEVRDLPGDHKQPALLGSIFQRRGS